MVGTTIWVRGFYGLSDTDTLNSDGIAFIVLGSHFCLCRVLHTIFLLKSIQPGRTIVFMIGILIVLLINLWGVGRVFKQYN